MDTRNPTAEELSELVSQVSAAFAYNKDESVARDFPQLYHPSNIRNLWGAWENGKLVAHAGFLPAIMKVEGIPLPVAGIGGVFCAPEFQGQGLASQLVNKCAEQAQMQGAALAFLWSDKHEFYGKLDFHLIGRQWTIALESAHSKALRSIGEKIGPAEKNFHFMENDFSPDFLAQSYAKQDSLSIGIARSPEEHSLLLTSGACESVAAWAGKDMAAYFLIGKGRDLQDYVHEWAGDEAALHFLAAYCLDRRQGRPLYALSPQFMPDETSWIYSLDEAGVPLRAEQLALVRLLDFPKVQKLVQAYMSNIGLVPTDLSLSRTSAGFEVSWRGNMKLQFSSPVFLRFLFGPDLPAHPELKAFLPLRLWYWGMDSV